MIPADTMRAALPDEVLQLLNHIEDVIGDEAWARIDAKLWNAVTKLAAGVPACPTPGYVLVPIEPSPAMLAELAGAWGAAIVDAVELRLRYRAMLVQASGERLNSAPGVAGTSKENGNG